jgi:hypothetical protein
MPQSSGSRTLYIATAGSDSNTGTLAAPFKTLCKALSVSASGTIINLRAGSYGKQLCSHKFFSPSNPVTIQSYPGERAIFIGQTSYTNAVTLADITGIRIRNVTFAARTNVNLKLESVKHLEIDHIVSRDSGRSCDPSIPWPGCGGQGLLVGGYPITGWTNSWSEDVQVWNSTFTNNGGTTPDLSGRPGEGGSFKHDHELYLGSCGSAYLGTAKCGVWGYVLANNVFVDNPTGLALQLGDAAHNGIVTNNTIDNTTTCQFSQAYTGAGIVLYSNNEPNASAGNLFVNNIISNNCGPAFEGVTGRSLTGNVVRNNLGFHNSYSCTWYGCKTEWDCTYGSYSTCTVGTNLSNADPKYADATATFGSLTKDLNLQTGSPALGKAEPAYAPPFDINGTPRPSAPALGAYQ